MDRQEAQREARKMAKTLGHTIGKIEPSGHAGNCYYGTCKVCHRIAGCKSSKTGWVAYGRATIEPCMDKQDNNSILIKVY